MSKLIPEGTYTASAVYVETKDGKVLGQFGVTGTGKKQVLVYFEVTSGPYAGQQLPWFGYLSEATFKRTLQALRYCGWTGDNVLDINAQPMDQLVEIVVEHNSYEDRETGETKTHPRVCWVNKIGGSRIKLANPMKNDEIRKMAAQLRSVARSIKTEPGDRRGDQPSNDVGDDAPDFFTGDETPPPMNDDIPF